MIVPKLCIPKRDYIKILLKLKCKDCVEVRDAIKVKFGLGKCCSKFVQKILFILYDINFVQRFLKFIVLRFLLERLHLQSSYIKKSLVSSHNSSVFFPVVQVVYSGLLIFSTEN